MTVRDADGMSQSEFSHYAKGMQRLRRFWPSNLSIVILAAWALWAYYSHLVLVIMLFAASLIASAAMNLVDGLIVAHEHADESLGGAT
jgi:hypothetical protein